jgi:hypothetical protein
MLNGFQERLVVRLGKGHDLTWPVLGGEIIMWECLRTDPLGHRP